MLLPFKDLKPFAKVSIAMMRIFQLKCFRWEGETNEIYSPSLEVKKTFCWF